MLEDVVVSDSVQGTPLVMGMDVVVAMDIVVAMRIVVGMDAVNSIPAADMFVKVEEDPRKSARKLENINGMRNQGLEMIKRLVTNTEYGDIE